MSDRGSASFSVMDISNPGQNLDASSEQSHVIEDLKRGKDTGIEKLDDDMEIKSSPDGLIATKGRMTGAADHIARAAIGGLVGAVPGAAIGAASDPEDRLEGAKRGAGIGAIGGLIGGMVSRAGMGERAAQHLQGFKKGSTEKFLKKEANRIPVAGAAGGTAAEIMADKGIKTIAQNIKRVADDALAPRRMLLREYPITTTMAAGVLGATAASAKKEVKEVSDNLVVGKTFLGSLRNRAKQKVEGIVRNAILDDVKAATEKAARDEVKTQSAAAERNVMEEVKRQGKNAREAATREVAKHTVRATGIGAGVGAAVGAGTAHLVSRKAEKGIETVPSVINTNPPSTRQPDAEFDKNNKPQSFATGNPIVEKKGIVGDIVERLKPLVMLGDDVAAAGARRIKGQPPTPNASEEKAKAKGIRTKSAFMDAIRADDPVSENEPTTSAPAPEPKPTTPAPNPVLGGYMRGTTPLAEQAEEMKGFTELDKLITVKGGEIKHIGFEGAEKKVEGEGYNKESAGKIIGAAKAHASAKAKARNPHLLNTRGHVTKGVVSDILSRAKQGIKDVYETNKPYFTEAFNKKPNVGLSPEEEFQAAQRPLSPKNPIPENATEEEAIASQKPLQSDPNASNASDASSVVPPKKKSRVGSDLSLLGLGIAGGATMAGSDTPTKGTTEGIEGKGLVRDVIAKLKPRAATPFEGSLMEARQKAGRHLRKNLLSDAERRAQLHQKRLDDVLSTSQEFNAEHGIKGIGEIEEKSLASHAIAAGAGLAAGLALGASKKEPIATQEFQRLHRRPSDYKNDLDAKQEWKWDHLKDKNIGFGGKKIQIHNDKFKSMKKIQVAKPGGQK